MLPAVLLVLVDESALPRAQWMQAQQVSGPVASGQVRELEPWVLPEPQQQAPLARPRALSLVVAEPPALLVWPLPLVRALPEPRALPDASARP